MPRPKNKEELLHLSKLNYDKLMVLVNGLDDSLKEEIFPEEMLNRNIRDVLAHLHHWHLLLLDWYEIGMRGDKPVMPAKGYSWKDLPRFNKWIRDQYSNVILDDAIKLFRESFSRVYNLIEGHSNEELFTKKKYGWTGSTSMGSYLVSSTSSHYDWAYKLIVKALKQKSR